MKNKELKVQIKYTQEGRVTIPREVRKLLKLEYTDAFDITVEDGKIILDPVDKIKCEICGKTEMLFEVYDRDANTKYYVCEECSKQIENSVNMYKGNEDGE